MPRSPPKPCAAPRCGHLVSGGRFCDEHSHRAREARGTAHERGYDARWRAARAAYLVAHPLCVSCEREGRTTAARVVDHIVPHRGDEKLFWDESNWQSLCDHTSPFDCHGAKTARGE